MEKLINLDKLYSSLKDIIENQEDIEKVKEIIIELHFSVQRFRFSIPISQDIEIDALEKISIYLLTTLTNIVSEQMKVYVKGFYSEGLNIAGLIFELLAEIEAEDIIKKHSFLLYCSVCYSLSGKEASSAVIADKMLANIKENNLFLTPLSKRECWENICLTLSRRFKILYKNRDNYNNTHEINTNNYWSYFKLLLIDNARCFVDGLSTESIFSNVDHLKRFLINNDDIEELYVVSLIYEVLFKMHEKSIWRVLYEQGFSDEYLGILSKFDSKNVYEVWNSQLEALRYNENHINYLSCDVKKAIISMPTSAGKSFIGELAIVKTLEEDRELKCVYVATTRALTAEIESNLFYRLRKLGFNVSAVFDTDENDYENDLLNEVNVLVVTPEKLDLLVRRNKEFIKKIGLIIFDEFHKVADNSRGWLLETLISWFFINQIQYDYKILLMSAIVSNTLELNNWMGNSDFDPIVSNWSPSRRIYGIVRKHMSDKDSIWIDVRKKVKELQVPNMLVYKYMDSSRIIEDIFRDQSVIKLGKKGWKKDPNNSDSKYDRCFKFIKFLNDNKVLIYFFTKIDLERFIEYSQAYLEIKEDERLKALKSFLKQRLGDEHPLVKNILYGIAYHHGDLPIEVRKEIEKSYKLGLIDILACTTTLSDGVNLPIKNFILGSFTSYDGEHKLSIADYKNIVGRAGRAYVDTEGKIFLIRHPEYFEGKNSEYFRRLVFCEEETTNVVSSMESNFDDIYGVLDELEEIVEITLRDIDKTVLDLIDRLQVFAFSLYEDFTTQSLQYDKFCDMFKKLLFSYQTDEEKMQKFNVVCNRYFDFASRLDNNTIKIYNKTGLSYRSNNVLKEIVREIAEREDAFNLSLENIITRDIFDKIISLKEIAPKLYKHKDGIRKVELVIDHYSAFLYWINGKSFIEIRDTIFTQDSNITSRTQICVNYINDMFLYKLPWAISSLYVLSKDRLFIVDSILRSLPAIIKYGVDNLEAIKLCTLGMESRELANKLTELFDADTTKDNDDTLEQWITEKSFYYFEKNISGIDDISIRQIARVRTKLRKRTSYLKDTGKIEFDIAGTPFYDFHSLFKAKQINIQTKIILVQERENLYDDFAVRVDTQNGNKIGYIPSTYAEEIFDYIEADQQLQIQILHLSYRKIVVKVSTA